MKRFVYLQQISPWGKVLILISLIILTALFTAFGSLLIVKVIFGIDIKSVATLLVHPETTKEIAFMKGYQLINQFGFFIFPVIVFSFLISPNPTGYFKLDRKPQLLSLLIGAMVIYTILPFNNYLTELNLQLKFPGFLHPVEIWMKVKEMQAGELTDIFLKTSTISGLMINLLVIALVPAIGEELLFRATGINLIKELTRNVHVAVLVTAFLFAFLHFQFLSFLPRFLLGLLLGYLYVISQSLWVPIFAHFVNNASSVIIYYLHYNGSIKISMDNFGATSNSVYIIGSFLITLWLMFILYRQEGANRFSL